MTIQVDQNDVSRFKKKFFTGCFKFGLQLLYSAHFQVKRELNLNENVKICFRAQVKIEVSDIDLLNGFYAQKKKKTLPSQ